MQALYGLLLSCFYLAFFHMLTLAVDQRRSLLYAQHRDLDHMPATSRPKRLLIQWGWLGWFVGKMRWFAATGVVIWLSLLVWNMCGRTL